LAKQHRKVARQRANTLQQLTTRLAKTKPVVVLEDRTVAGLLKTHQLAQALAEVGFAEVRRPLVCKAAWYSSSRGILASRWEPSSTTYAACGWVDADLTLTERTVHSKRRDVVLDRDLNAAITVRARADSPPASRNACGGESAGAGLGGTAQVELPSG